MTIKKLRQAMMEDPCGAHADECPIPMKKGAKKRGCQWGHTAIEFADDCDDCAGKFLTALKVGSNVAQRMHHQKHRV